MIDIKLALRLSDGTPVQFVKITSNGNIQVRVPIDTAIGAEDPLRIFRPDGTHYRDELDVTLEIVPVAYPERTKFSTSIDAIAEVLRYGSGLMPNDAEVEFRVPLESGQLFVVTAVRLAA